ncbi:MAG: hypothetical protein FD167_2217 [bacterium]|nr:MAG: hypothetical protein FD167_2217 [bacterium]
MRVLVRLVLRCLLLFTLLTPFATQAQNSSSKAQSKNYITLSTDVVDLKEQFNKDQGKTRLLMVLSPG